MNRWLLIGLLLAGSLLLTACAKNDDDEPVPTVAVLPSLPPELMPATAEATEEMVTEEATTAPTENATEMVTEEAATEDIATEVVPDTAATEDIATEPPAELPEQTEEVALPTEEALTETAVSPPPADTLTPDPAVLLGLPTTPDTSNPGDLLPPDESSLPTPTSLPPLFEVEANLPALAAFDAAWPQLEEQVGEADWIALTGSRSFGWLASFYDRDNEQILAFNINPDGNVIALPPEAPDFMTEDAAPLNRQELAVDSDEAEQIAAEQGLAVSDETSPPLLFLRGVTEGNPSWLVTSTQDAGSILVDAITGEIIPQ